MRFLVLALLLQAKPTAEPERAEVQDVVGDAEPSYTGVTSPDLRSASVEASSARGLLLKVRFARHTFQPASTFVQFSLSLGEGRGVPGDDCQACGNYLLDINGVHGRLSEAEVRRLSTDSRYDPAGTVPVSVLAEGADVVIPWSLLPKDVSRLTYRVVTCVKLKDDALSPILDRMPDSGLPPIALAWK